MTNNEIIYHLHISYPDSMQATQLVRSCEWIGFPSRQHSTLHTISLSNEVKFCIFRDECQLYRGHDSSFPRSHLRSTLVFF